jgi:Domain of unknown function (DUF4265)
MDAKGLTRVFFMLDPTDWHGLHTESLWAEPIAGAHGGDLFVVRNSPFYTRDVSYLDVVRAVPGIHIRGLDFVGLMGSRGHSTYRLLLQEEGGEFDQYWKRLQDLGCTYEWGTVIQGTLYSVDVPDTTDIHEVYKILEEGQNDGVWMFDEGRVGHPVKSES